MIDDRGIIKGCKGAAKDYKRVIAVVKRQIDCWGGTNREARDEVVQYTLR